MPSEIIKTGKKFIKEGGFPVYLTLIVFVYLFSLIGHILNSNFSVEGYMIFIAVLSTSSMIFNKWNFVKAVIDDLQKLPNIAHYSFVILVVIGYLFIKFNILGWIYSYYNSKKQLKLNGRSR